MTPAQALMELRGSLCMQFGEEYPREFGCGTKERPCSCVLVANATDTLDDALTRTGTNHSDALRAHLREHFLSAIVCDHEAETDTPHCACSQWPCEPQKSVGAAVDRWIDHFIATMPAQPRPASGGGLQEALRLIASRGLKRWGDQDGAFGCQTCKHWWSEEEKSYGGSGVEHHDKYCAYVIARDALANPSPVANSDSTKEPRRITDDEVERAYAVLLDSGMLTYPADGPDQLTVRRMLFAALNEPPLVAGEEST